MIKHVNATPSFSTYKVGDNSVECGSLVVKGLPGLALSLLASATYDEPKQKHSSM